jgi:hypothetical protein
MPHGLFGVRRSAPDDSQHVYAVANLTSRPHTLTMSRLDRRWRQRRWRELIGGWRGDAETMTGRLELAPYQAIWLTPTII